MRTAAKYCLITLQTLKLLIYLPWHITGTGVTCSTLPHQDSLSQAYGLSLSSSAAVSSFFRVLPTPRPWGQKLSFYYWFVQNLSDIFKHNCKMTAFPSSDVMWPKKGVFQVIPRSLTVDVLNFGGLMSKQQLHLLPSNCRHFRKGLFSPLDTSVCEFSFSSSIIFATTSPFS